MSPPRERGASPLGGRAAAPLLGAALAGFACGGGTAPSAGHGPVPRASPDAEARPPPVSVSAADGGTRDGAPPARTAPTRRAALKYELNGRAFPLPVVHGTVAGRPTWMLVDTGANSHVVAGYFARRAGLPLDKLGDVGTDHTGKSIPTYRVEHPRVAVDEWGPLADGPMLVTDVPPVIEKLGIGAFLSPQHMLEEGDSVVMDLSGATLRAAWFEDAARAIEGLSLPAARACVDDESPIKGLAYVLPARVAGHPVDLLVDTGAQRTDLLASSRAGRSLLPQTVIGKEEIFAASGKITSRVLKGARIDVGAFSLAGDIDILPGAADEVCPRDGVVSMDVLRGCVLVLGNERFAAKCK